MSDHECDTGIFDRTLCPEPCDTMHSFCATCGERQDPCAHDSSADEVEKRRADLAAIHDWMFDADEDDISERIWLAEGEVDCLVARVRELEDENETLRVDNTTAQEVES